MDKKPHSAFYYVQVTQKHMKVRYRAFPLFYILVFFDNAIYLASPGPSPVHATLRVNQILSFFTVEPDSNRRTYCFLKRNCNIEMCVRVGPGAAAAAFCGGLIPLIYILSMASILFQMAGRKGVEKLGAF